MTATTKTAALVVGAGAVENAWAPVLRALQPYHDFQLTADGANSFLARLIFLIRWWASSDSPLFRAELAKHKKFLATIRQAICTELKLAETANEIRVRSDFEEIVKAMLIEHSREFMLVTTNWDCVVETTLAGYLNRKFRCTVLPLHVHGSVANPDTLYLPTEMTKEPYRSSADNRQSVVCTAESGMVSNGRIESSSMAFRCRPLMLS